MAVLSRPNLLVDERERNHAEPSAIKPFCATGIAVVVGIGSNFAQKLSVSWASATLVNHSVDCSNDTVKVKVIRFNIRHTHELCTGYVRAVVGSVEKVI